MERDNFDDCWSLFGCTEEQRDYMLEKMGVKKPNENRPNIKVETNRPTADRVKMLAEMYRKKLKKPYSDEDILSAFEVGYIVGLEDAVLRLKLANSNELSEYIKKINESIK